MDTFPVGSGMLTASDIVAAKLLVQMKQASADTLRKLLIEVDQVPQPGNDLINRLYNSHSIDERILREARRYVALYTHVRAEALYMRMLERRKLLDRELVVKLLALIESESFRRRLGDVLVQQGHLRPQTDSQLVQRQIEVLRSEDSKIVERYRKEQFKGISRALVPSKQVSAKAFRISKIFRSKNTQKLVRQHLKEFRRGTLSMGSETDSWAVEAIDLDQRLPTANPELDQTIRLNSSQNTDASLSRLPALQNDVVETAIMNQQDLLCAAQAELVTGDDGKETAIMAVNPASLTPPALDETSRGSVFDTTMRSSAEVKAALQETTAMSAAETTAMSAAETTGNPNAVKARTMVLSRKKFEESSPQDIQIGSYLVTGGPNPGQGGVLLYDGRHSSNGTEVVMRVLDPRKVSQDETDRFRRQIQVMSSFQDERCLRLLDWGDTADGWYYMVMPRLEGSSLKDLLAKSGALKIELAFHIAEELLQALSSLHQTNFVYRDLQPGNILLLGDADDPKPKIVLTDFRLARPTEEDEDDSIDEEGLLFCSDRRTRLGDPGYMAPESAANDPIDPRTDLYSLGVILFEMLSGKLPLRAESREEFLKQHLIGQPYTLAEIKGDVNWSEELERLLATLLAKDKEDRPDDAAALLKRLPYVQHVTISAARKPPALQNNSPHTGVFNRYFKMK